MAMLAFMVMLFWGGSVFYALLYVRNHLSDEAVAEYGAVSMRKQLKGRLVAFCAAGIGLLAVGSATSLVSGPGVGNMWPLLGIALLVCGIPLLVPQGTFRGKRVTSVALVGTSMALTLVSGVAMAIYFVARIILSNPEILN